jgi:hypothetical protein
MDEIVQALAQAGAFVIRLNGDAGFDLVVAAPSGTYIIKVGRLGPNDIFVKSAVEQAGGGYFVIETAQEALDLVSGHWVAAMKSIEQGARHELQHC